jgi:hypothetical protein
MFIIFHCFVLMALDGRTGLVTSDTLYDYKYNLLFAPYRTTAAIAYLLDVPHDLRLFTSLPNIFQPALLPKSRLGSA